MGADGREKECLLALFHTTLFNLVATGLLWRFSFLLDHADTRSRRIVDGVALTRPD